MSLFRPARENFQGVLHCGRPSTAESERDVATVKMLSEETARYTIAKLSNISGFIAPGKTLFQQKSTDDFPISLQKYIL